MYRPNHMSRRAIERAADAILAAHPKPRAERSEFRDSSYTPCDIDPVPFTALFDAGDDDEGDAADINRGYIVTDFDDEQKPPPRRSLRNVDLEKRSRARLRERAKRDPGAFRAEIPADILDRLVMPHGDDVPAEVDPEARLLDPDARRYFRSPPTELCLEVLPIARHPALTPSWHDAPKGDGRFQAPPRIKANVSPGLVVGAANVATADCLATANIHGILIGLRRADQAKVRHPAPAPTVRQTKWAGRKLDRRELMAFAAGRGTVPKFLAGINFSRRRDQRAAAPVCPLH